MSDALWGVLVGGLIAGVPPLVTLWFNAKNDTAKWKRDAKLTYLRAERDRLEKFYSAKYLELDQAIHLGKLTPEMIAEVRFLLPGAVTRTYIEFIAKDDRSDEARINALGEMAAAMKRDLAARDEEILQLVS